MLYCMYAMIEDRIVIGMDLGGSLNKIIVISTFILEVKALELHGQTTINQQPQYIYSALVRQVLEFLALLKASLQSNKPKIQIGVTGCGGIKYFESIKDIFPTSEYMNEFQANPQGLYVYDKIGMKVTLHSIGQQESSHQIQHKKEPNKRISQISTNFMFVSLGSGANFQKLGLCEKGMQRKKVDEAATSYDGYSLGGTSLGAAYLFGLVSILNNQTDRSTVVQSLSQDKLSLEIYNTMIVNLMQHALNLSVLHKLEHIVVCGSLLKLKGSFDEQFKSALKLNHHERPLRRCLLQLDAFGGLIGALGAIHKYI